MDKQIELSVGPPGLKPVQQNFKIKTYHLFKIHFAKTRQRHIWIILDFTVSHHSTLNISVFIGTWGKHLLLLFCVNIGYIPHL